MNKTITEKKGTKSNAEDLSTYLTIMKITQVLVKPCERLRFGSRRLSSCSRLRHVTPTLSIPRKRMKCYKGKGKPTRVGVGWVEN